MRRKTGSARQLEMDEEVVIKLVAIAMLRRGVRVESESSLNTVRIEHRQPRPRVNH